MSKYDCKPVFHRDGSISYYWPSYGWVAKVHPCQIQRMVIETWQHSDRVKWGEAMKRRGFVMRRGEWIPVHQIAVA